MTDIISRQAAIDALLDLQVEHRVSWKDAVLDMIMDLPSAQSETELLPDTKAVPDDRDMVCLSERVSATYYDDEHEEWTQKSVTIAEVLDSVCDEYTVVPTAQPEQRWIPCSKTIDIPDHEVLCCDKYGEELIGWLSYSDDQWLCESDGEMMYDPIAWCEKPEQWRGEK